MSVLRTYSGRHSINSLWITYRSLKNKKLLISMQFFLVLLQLLMCGCLCVFEWWLVSNICETFCFERFQRKRDKLRFNLQLCNSEILEYSTFLFVDTIFHVPKSKLMNPNWIFRVFSHKRSENKKRKPTVQQQQQNELYLKSDRFDIFIWNYFASGESIAKVIPLHRFVPFFISSPVSIARWMNGSNNVLPFVCCMR